uniref:Putative reverse transcriptase, RNA-dependent DNA polymerase n=1 Tax=Tanacetum cinerariifolium TaxID=118510 RepID=A0A699HHA6_TANCI|nr:putative reverse transcriptase, RNA-dependent DNA polymerase [Tanacetum cinerariifolium]
MPSSNSILRASASLRNDMGERILDLYLSLLSTSFKYPPIWIWVFRSGFIESGVDYEFVDVLVCYEFGKNTTAYIDSDYARASLDMKSTTGGCQFLGCRLISWQCKKQIVVANSTTETEYIDDGKAVWNRIGAYAGDSKLILLGISYYCWVKVNVVEDGNEIIITESSIIRDLRLADGEGIDFLPNSTIFEQLTLTSMIRNLDNLSGSAIPTDPHHTLIIIQPSTQPQKKQQPRKPKRKDTQVPQPSDPIENVPDKVVHKELGDSLVRGATTASSLEADQDSESLGEDASKQRRIDVIDADKEITLVSVQDEVVSNDADKEMFDVDVLDGEEVLVAEHEVTVKRVNDEVNVVEELVEVINTAKLIIDDKGKRILIEPVIEHVKPMKRKDQIRLDEEAAIKLQAEFDEEERLAREKAEKLVEGKEKRAGIELIQEITKKQKVEDDKKTAKLKQFMEIIPDEKEVAIDAIPLSVKSPKIVDRKIYKEGRKSYYQIMRADGESQMYMAFSQMHMGFSQMLKSFNSEDLEDLYKLVKAKYESTRLVEDLDLLLWGGFEIKV